MAKTAMLAKRYIEVRCDMQAKADLADHAWGCSGFSGCSQKAISKKVKEARAIEVVAPGIAGGLMSD